MWLSTSFTFFISIYLHLHLQPRKTGLITPTIQSGHWDTWNYSMSVTVLRHSRDSIEGLPWLPLNLLGTELQCENIKTISFWESIETNFKHWKFSVFFIMAPRPTLPLHPGPQPTHPPTHTHSRAGESREGCSAIVLTSMTVNAGNSLHVNRALAAPNIGPQKIPLCRSVFFSFLSGRSSFNWSVFQKPPFILLICSKQTSLFWRTCVKQRERNGD